MTTVRDIFQQFCKERHAEDKGRNYNLLQEIYADTELFDFSLIDHEFPRKRPLDFTVNGNTIKTTIKNFSLPFKACFVNIRDMIQLFIREYSPEILTGTVRILQSGTEDPFVDVVLNFPFTIRLNGEFMNIICECPPHWLSYQSKPLTEKEKDEYVETLEKFNKELIDGFELPNSTGYCLDIVNEVGEIFETLSKKAVLSDVPTIIKYDYYRRKKAPTIKVARRPIYYVLGDKKDEARIKYAYKGVKSEGKLEYSYAFKVRGHWRRIADKSFGKDRLGVYGVKGFTWVVDHIRGEGELSKRLRVVR